MRKLIFAAVAAGAAAILVQPVKADAQWATTYEQMYLPGGSNWQFRHNYPAADKLFNAFDYGHAILYEKLYTKPGAPVSILESKEYDFITKELLVNPPSLPLEEAAIEVEYAKLAPEAKMMFDWAHLLHRQIYDAWADERLTVPQKDARVQELIRYYKTRKDLAFSSRPKNMDLMEGQPYSLAFRKNYPKFNGLIWAYHWLQVGLYEPLLAGANKDERQTGVLATVARFRQMIEAPPTWMPRMMPMSPAVAPLFTARYPEAAIIFDNLHSMHDVVSDILANPNVPRDRKRAEIMIAASRYRDDTSFVMTPDEWRAMALGMGIENMGGPVRGFLAGFPTPTVERGAVVSHSMMNGMDHSAMAGAAKPAPAMAGMDHSAMAGMDHSGMAGMSMDSMDDHDAALMKLHKQMMADPVIRARVDADPVMRKMMQDMMAKKSTRSTATKSPVKKSGSKAPVKKATATKKPAAPTTKKTPPKTDPMAGMDHSKMNMDPKKKQ